MADRCSRCLYTADHPLGMTFQDGVCLGCITHEEKTTLDWSARRALLEETLRAHSRNSRAYDCVVPVVGDAEDYFTLETVLSMGMSPLVVCVNDMFRNDIGWHNLHNLITRFDVDSLVFSPDLVVYRELVRNSLRKFDHVLLPFLQLHTSFPVHIALQRSIPLVVWGQNQAVEQVGKFSCTDEVEMSRWYRKENDLFGVDLKTLIGNGAGVRDRNLNFYRYPEPAALHARSVRGIYLSNYIPWDPLVQNNGALRHGFLPQRQSGTFDPYERAGSSVYYGLHDLLKRKRIGYRKVEDHLTREIRHGRLTRSQAQSLASRYSCSRIDIRPFFDWLGVTESGYRWFVDHRLAVVSASIGDGGSGACDTAISLPSSVAELLMEGAEPSRSFIPFGKGLRI